MKKTIVKLLLILAALFVSIGSTIAYLTDTDGDINVLTLGRVEIDLIEQERGADGSLTDYKDNHPILPGVYQKDPPTDANGYWQDVHNAVDKIVSVKNTGNTSAYVRIWFAFEVTADNNFFDEKLHLNKNESDDWYWELLRDDDGSYTFLEQNGTRYVMAVATYTKELLANESTSVSLRQVMLDASATNEDLIGLGEKYSIFVVAQAIQAQGFNSTKMARTYVNSELNNAVAALNEGFGMPSADTVPFEGMSEEDNETLNDNTNVIVINTADEFIALARATSGYTFVNSTIALGSDIDLGNKPVSTFAISDGYVIFDGRGHTISNLSMSGWGLFSVYRGSNLTLKNLYIDGVSNEAEAYAGVLVGEAGGVVEIENCHISNATIRCHWSGDLESSDAGIFAGFLNVGIITNCSVKNCTVYSEDKVGSIVGAACYAQITNIIEENVNLFIQKDETVTEYQPSGCNTRYGTIHGKMVRNEWDWKCSDCGENEDHSCQFICGELEPCVCCGAFYSPDDYYPIHQWQYSDVTSQTHTIECASCGKILITEEGSETEEHHAYCLEADDGVCAGCGASNVTIGRQWHNYGYLPSTQEKHFYGCNSCGYVVITGNHRGYCTKPGMCIECEANSISLETVYHNNYTYKDITDETHTWGCVDCDYANEPQSHSGACGDLDKCLYCGAEGVKLGTVSHNYTYKDITNDTHTQYCTNCDYAESPEPHVAVCTDPEKCILCGAEDVKLETFLVHEFTYKDITNDTHTQYCTSCDYAEKPQSHSGYCTDPDKCTMCGADGVKLGIVFHNYTYKHITDDTHTWGCVDCDYANEPQSHSGYCTDPDKCTMCGADGVKLGSMSHNYTFKITNDSHTQYCTNCDDAQSPVPHVAFCTDPDKCTTCGAEGVKFILLHSGTYKDITNDTHTWGCTNCNYTEKPQSHWAVCTDPDKCIICGAEGVKLGTVSHNYTYKDITNDTHTQYCTRCDYAQTPQPHSGSCTDPDKCTVCGADGVKLENVDHSKFTYKDITPDSHTRYCSNCDYVESPESHDVVCTDINMCVTCGTNDVESANLKHMGGCVECQ